MKSLYTYITIAVLLYATFAKAQGAIKDSVSYYNNQTYHIPSYSYFGQGTNLLSVGIGAGGGYPHVGEGYAKTPDLIFTYENGTFGHVGPGTISLGGVMSYKGISNDYMADNFIYRQNWNYFILSFRAAYHWNFTHNPRCDLYGGLMLSYYNITYALFNNNPYGPSVSTYYFNNANYSNYIAPSAFLGFRYFVTQKIGVWTELGYGYSALAVGGSLQF